MAEKTRVKYSEGQWFAVPLRDTGYAVGIIARGNYKTRGGLGYFFGPKYLQIPTGAVTYSKNKSNSIFICRFGDLGIIQGKWPLISKGKPFTRDDWPVPLFFRTTPSFEDKAVIVEYDQDFSGFGKPTREFVSDITDEILEFPEDGLCGYGFVEIRLTRLFKSRK